jgi:hypothetical protein
MTNQRRIALFKNGIIVMPIGATTIVFVDIK